MEDIRSDKEKEEDKDLVRLKRLQALGLMQPAGNGATASSGNPTTVVARSTEATVEQPVVGSNGPLSDVKVITTAPTQPATSATVDVGPGINVSINIFSNIDLEQLNNMVSSLVIGLRSSMNVADSRGSSMTTVTSNQTTIPGSTDLPVFKELSTTAASTVNGDKALTTSTPVSLGAVPKARNWREVCLFPDTNTSAVRAARADWRERQLQSQPSTSALEASSCFDRKEPQRCTQNAKVEKDVVVLVSGEESEDMFASENEDKSKYSKGPLSSSSSMSSEFDKKTKQRSSATKRAMAQMASYIAKQVSGQRSNKQHKKLLTDSSTDTDGVRPPPPKKHKREREAAGAVGPVRATQGNEEDPNKGNCAICLEKPPDCCLRCKHAYCQRCLERLRKDKQPCPKCKKGFRTWDRIFL